MDYKYIIPSNTTWLATLQALWDAQQCVRITYYEKELFIAISVLHLLVLFYALVASSIMLAALLKLRIVGYKLVPSWIIVCIISGMLVLLCNATLQLCLVSPQFDTYFFQITDTFANGVSRVMLTSQFHRNWGFTLFALIEALISQPFINYYWILKIKRMFWVELIVLIGSTITFAFLSNNDFDYIRCHGSTHLGVSVAIRKRDRYIKIFLDNIIINLLPALFILIFKLCMLKAILAISVCDKAIESRMSFLTYQTRLTYFLFGSLVAVGITDICYEVMAIENKVAIHMWTWYTVKPIYDGIIQSVFVGLLSQEVALTKALDTKLKHNNNPGWTIDLFRCLKTFHNVITCHCFCFKETDRLLVFRK